MHPHRGTVTAVACPHGGVRLARTPREPGRCPAASSLSSSRFGARDSFCLWATPGSSGIRPLGGGPRRPKAAQRSGLGAAQARPKAAQRRGLGAAQARPNTAQPDKPHSIAAPTAARQGSTPPARACCATHGLVLHGAILTPAAHAHHRTMVRGPHPATDEESGIDGNRAAQQPGRRARAARR